jgi:hypothetical protein
MPSPFLKCQLFHFTYPLTYHLLSHQLYTNINSPLSSKSFMRTSGLNFEYHSFPET